MPGNAFKHGVGCGCCECPQSLCVYVQCMPPSSNYAGPPLFGVGSIPGATVTVRDSGDNVVAECTTGVRDPAAGAAFSAAGHLWRDDHAFLRSANRFWIAGWVKPSGVALFRRIAHKTTASGLDYELLQSATDVTFRYYGPAGMVSVTATGALSVSAFAHVLAYIDQAADQIGLIVDGGTPATAPIGMAAATVTATFPFLATTEGFVHLTSSGTFTAAWTGSDGDPAAGSLQAYSSQLGAAAVGRWQLGTTWTNLGVPSGASVTAVRLQGVRTKAYTKVADATCVIGPYTLNEPSGGSSLGTLWAGRTPSGTEAGWTATGAQADLTVPFAYRSAGTSVQFRLGHQLGGGFLDGEAGVRTDSLQLTATYTVPSGGSIGGASGGFFYLGDGDVSPADFAGTLDEFFVGVAPAAITFATIATRLHAPAWPQRNDCACMTASEKSALGVKAAWSLSESEGTRLACHGGLHLSPSGTVGSADGAVGPCFDASGGCCVSLSFSPPATFTVEVVPPEGYQPASQEVEITFANCLTPRAYTFGFCTETYTVNVAAYGCGGFALPGAGLAVSGDQTDSGTTDSGGVASFTFTRPADCEGESLTVTATAPSARGLAPYTAVYPNPATIGNAGYGCLDAFNVRFEFLSAAGYVCGCGGPYPVPASPTYADDRGSTALTIQPSGFGYVRRWAGSFDYWTGTAADMVECWEFAGTPCILPIADQGNWVHVGVELRLLRCEGSTMYWKLQRSVFVKECCVGCPPSPPEGSLDCPCLSRVWRAGALGASGYGSNENVRIAYFTTSAGDMPVLAPAGGWTETPNGIVTAPDEDPGNWSIVGS